MIPGRRSPPALLVVAALVGGSLGACSASGTLPPGADRTTTTRPPSGEGPPGSSTPTPTPPADDPPVDPTVDDVPDTVFVGLGDPRIDVTHYDVALRAEPGAATVAGRATLTLAARTARPLTSFTLDLRGPRVGTVTVDGEPARVRATDAEIEVTPASPIAPAEPVDVTLTYSGAPGARDFPRLGIPVGWQDDDAGGSFTLGEPDGTSSWVPVNDHPSDKATWTITVDTPADVTAVSNGRLTSRRQVGDRRHWRWDQDQPMASYLALVAVGRYDLVERAGPAGSRVVVAFPHDLPAADRRAFDDLDAILGFYSETFGPYPDDDTGAVIIPSRLGLALETQTRPIFGLDGVEDGEVWALAHELAHQWFGNAVTPARWSDLWLNESFASYADWLWIEHLDGTPLNQLADDDEAPLNRSDLPVLSTEAAATFDPAVYGNGARALLALRLTIGDDHFSRLLRRWFSTYRGATVTTDDFTRLASEVAGRDLTAFFDTWLRTSPQPALPR